MSKIYTSRLIYVDNIRLFLIILVILQHVSIIYGGSGLYPIKEIPTDSISPIILTIFNAINQSFFMSLFFLLSGYFTPSSFDRKGAGKFFTDRLIRLGIPLLFYTTIFRVVLDFLFLNFNGTAISFSTVLINDITNPAWFVGPLWFVEALLIFSAVYALYRIFKGKSFKIFTDRFPKNTTITATIVILAALTFIVRIFSPVGVETHVFQLGHFVDYIFCFWIGIIAYRGNWLTRLTEKQAGLWKKVAIINIFALLLIFFIFFFIQGSNTDYFMGGLTYQSAIYSAWESVACFSIIIGLISIFKKRFDRQGKLVGWMAPNFYTVYIIHQTVITPIVILISPVAISTFIKFFIVSFLAVTFCFVISDLIRRIPYTKRVLG